MESRLAWSFLGSRLSVTQGVPGSQVFGFGDRNELYRVPGDNGRRDLPRGIEQGQVGAADDPPASGGFGRVGAGLAAADRHGAFGDLDAGGGQAWGVEPIGQPAEVGKAGGEPDHVHVVLGLAVQPDHLSLGEAGVFRDVGKVRPVLTRVHGGDLDEFGRSQVPGIEMGSHVSDPCLHVVEGCHERVVFNPNGAVRGNHLDQAREQLTRSPRALPRLRLNPTVRELDDFRFEDVTLEAYDPEPAIRAPVAV